MNSSSSKTTLNTPNMPTSSLPRPHRLSIYSQFTLHKSLKNYPKHFKTLHLETESYPPSKTLLKSLNRRAKSLKALSLEKYEQLVDLKPSKTLSLIRSFPHIQSLTLPGDNDKYFFIRNYIKWLQRSKRLLHFTSGAIPLSHQMRLRQSPFKNKNPSLLESLQVKYKKALKRAKLCSITLQSPQDILSKSHLSYPSSLKKLSISSYFLMASFNLNLSHLPNLSSLHINLPISFLHLFDTLQSLPNPHQLTHLTTRASDSFNRANKETFKLPESLDSLQYLHSLHLAIKNFLFATSCLKSFKNPENLSQLTIHIPIQNEQELLELASSIESFPNLSQFAIKNSKSIPGQVDNAHREFFHQISRLTKLKSLEINLYGEKMVMPSIGTFHGCMEKLANCVDKLDGLQEMTFSQSEIYLENEFYLLAEVLKKKGSNLKKLCLKFMNRENQKDHLEIFNEAIGKMRNLEELKLEGLWTGNESLTEFCHVISELKWLRSIYFDFIHAGLNQVEFTRIVREILMKNGLEELKWFGDVDIKIIGKVEPVDIKEVLMRNPRLQRIAFRSFIRDNKILSFVNKNLIAS